MSEIKSQKLDAILKYLPKSKIKAGDGKQIGKYRFFKSGADQSKFIDTANFEGESLIIGDGGSANINFYDKRFSTSDHCYVIQKQENSDIDMKYIYYFFKTNIHILEAGFKGAGLKNISKRYISNIKIPMQPLEHQRIISSFLTQIEELIQKRETSIKLLDELIKSTFLDMFGDPVLNPKNWGIEVLNNFGEIITGNTPPRVNKEYYSDNYIEWIKTNNILKDEVYPITAKEYLSQLGLTKSRFVTEGALLITCIAGSVKSIGNICIVDRKVAFNQQINAIQPNDSMNSIFIYYLLKIGQRYIQNQAGVGMKKIITKSTFQNIKFPKPPKEIQNQFANIATQIEQTKEINKESLKELENFFNSIAQKAFNGELDISKIDMQLQQTEEKEDFKMLDKEQLLELIKKGDFDPKDYINEKQSYDNIRDMIIGTKEEKGLIDDGLVVQRFDEESKKISLEAIQ